MRIASLLFIVCFATGCLQPYVKFNRIDEQVVPAEAYSRSVHDGTQQEFSIYRAKDNAENQARARMYPAAPITRTTATTRAKPGFEQPQAVGADESIEGWRFREMKHRGDPKLLQHGLELKRSVGVQSPQFVQQQAIQQQNQPQYAAQHRSPAAAFPPPGSSSPYINGQMTANPSLWPGQGVSGGSLFRDFRAFQAMDLITILVNEDARGKKKAETDAESEFDLLAGITEFFGIETRDWAANNSSLNPASLIQASTSTEFKGEAETNRSGSLSARISAVIMEVLPNGLLRVEGTKIISLNNEEEILVISGLIRQRDISASNQVDSSRIANMRIDFYGRGIIADEQSPGWAARIFKLVWPF